VQIISDPSEIDKYLENESCAQRQSAIGIANVDSWSNVDVNAEKLRAAIIAQANEPIVEPKDEWDICLDSGAAFPHKSKIKNNPFKDFDRNSYTNEFQRIQSDGSMKQRNRMGSDRKKRQVTAHNKHRFHRRRQRMQA